MKKKWLGPFGVFLLLFIAIDFAQTTGVVRTSVTLRSDLTRWLKLGDVINLSGETTPRRLIPSLTQAEIPTNAECPFFVEWVKQWTTWGYPEYVIGIATDSSGIYAASHYSLKKFDQAGNIVWDKNDWGSPLPADVAVDSSGIAPIIYLITRVQKDYGYLDCRVYRFSADGGLIDSWEFGTPEWITYACSATVDTSGNIYIVGNKWMPSPYDEDIFVTKRNASGAEVWTREFGSEYSYNVGWDVAVDSFGNVLVAGTLGGVGAFVKKYDSDGNPVTSFGTNGIVRLGTPWSAEEARAVAVDSSGRVYICGDYDRPPEGTWPYLQSFDINGIPFAPLPKEFAQQGRAFDLIIDTSGDVFVTAVTWGSYPGFELKGPADVILSGFNANSLEELWTTQFGTEDNDCPTRIALDSSGVYVGGGTCGAFPGFVHVGNGWNPYIAKLVPGSPEKQLTNLANLIQYSVASGGIASDLQASLLAKVSAAADALARGNLKVAVNNLKLLISQVQAQTGKKIDPAVAAEIILQAKRIIAALEG